VSDKKILTPKDAHEVAETIVGNLIQGRLTYFSLVVAHAANFGSCFFSPTSMAGDRGMLFVGDYETILRALLSHPKMSDIEYRPEEDVVTATFEDPFPEEAEG